MSCASAAVANGAPVKPLSPSRSPWKPSAASRGRIGRVPARSSVLAGPSSRSNSEPCLSQMANTFTPLISLPPSIPRVQAVGAERRERLSATTAEGRTSSSQARRQSPARRWPRRRHKPSRAPAGEGAVQRGERNTRQPAGDAPLHAAKGERPDQPDEASPQAQVRFAAATVHTDPLALHGLQLRFDREDEDLDVSQGVPAVTSAEAGKVSGRRRRQIRRARGTGAGHWPNMVSPAPLARCFTSEQLL